MSLFTVEEEEILANLNITFVGEKMNDLQLSLNSSWVLLTGSLVFFMQAGFAMLEAGSVRSKNVKNILLKNLLDASMGALGFYVTGYALAFGDYEGIENANGFCGTTFFCLSGAFQNKAGNGLGYAHFFFEWAFAVTSATIVSGSVAERMTLLSYLLYAFFITAWVYPIVAHWEWSLHGWLSAFNPVKSDRLFETGMIDFAGDGVVHMVGGVSGLVGAYVIGPRMGRFGPNGEVVPMKGHDATLCALGTFILWFGWYGFNPGSTLSLTGNNQIVAALAAVNTTLATAAAVVTAFVVQRVVHKNFDLIGVLNGCISGLVSITAGCSVVEPWAAIIIGAIGVPIYYACSYLLIKLKIDDPIDAAPVHVGCGIWGLLSVGFFAAPHRVHMYYGHSNGGVFYSQGRLMACQLIGIISVTAWVVGNMLPFFYILKKLKVLRIKASDEIVGLDISKHGGSAYPEQESRVTALESIKVKMSRQKDVTPFSQY